MRAQVHLRFSVDVESAEEAWDLAEGLEQAAMKRDYVAVSAWVEEDDSDVRAQVLVPEGQDPLSTQAEKVLRVPGNQVTGVRDPLDPSASPLTPSVFGHED